MAAPGQVRRIDLFRRGGPLTIGAAAQDVELLNELIPTDSDSEIVALGWEVSPPAGADYLRFRLYVDQHPEPDYFDSKAQPGTVPIPYLASVKVRRGQRIRVTVSNDDAGTAYRCNARIAVELGA